MNKQSKYIFTEEHRRNIGLARIGKYTGKNHPSWKGGRIIDKDGYILIHKPEHPNSFGRGYICEHRLIMEEYLGRYLTKDEVVHHINENKQDNRIENLELMTKSEHRRLHTIGKKNPNYKDGSRCDIL